MATNLFWLLNRWRSDHFVKGEFSRGEIMSVSSSSREEVTIAAVAAAAEADRLHSPLIAALHAGKKVSSEPWPTILDLAGVNQGF